MNRRQFMKNSLMGAAGLFVGCDNYVRSVMDKRDKEEGKFLESLHKYVIKARTDFKYTTKADVEVEDKREGMGIVFEDKYFTLCHIVDLEQGIPMGTPFGVFMYKPEKLEVSTSINGTKLEKLVFDETNDIAIFNIPKDLKVEKFPYGGRTQVHPQERVAVIGNPNLLGYNCRIGRISDMDGLDIDIPGLGRVYKNSIGVDLGVIPGDSGTPVISMEDKKFLGLAGLHFHNLGYFQPLRNFYKAIENKDIIELTKHNKFRRD